MNGDSRLDEFAARLKAKMTAWYLGSKNNYSSCETCGTYDDTKPDQETVCQLIDETLEEMKALKTGDSK